MFNKNLLIVLAIAAVASAFLAPKHAEPIVNITDEKIEVYFVKDMTQASLDTVQSKLKAVGVEILYSQLKFDGEHIIAMKFEVNDPRGHKGSAMTTFPLLPKHNFGFVIDLREGAKVPFAVGGI